MSKKINESEAREIWEYWYPLVYGYFYKRLNSRSDIEELAANTVGALILKTDVRNAKAFIWQTAKNQLVEFIKQKNKNFVLMDESAIDNISQTEDGNFAIDAGYSSNFSWKIEKMMHCIQENLKDVDLDIMRMSLIQGCNSNVIGEKLNLKPNLVRQRLKRACDKLKQKCVELFRELSTVNN